MHAVVIRDGRLNWEERDDPVAGDTELLVAVRAAGINGADMAQRAGGYPAPPGWPQDIPGMEMAGEVVAAGRQVTLFAPGDRVMAVVGGGAQATMARVDESHALAVPDSVGWPEAGGFPEVFCTAYDALFTQAGLADAASGCSSAAPPAGSARRACSWPRRPGRRSRRRCGTPRCTTRCPGARGRRMSSSRGARESTAPMTSSSSWSARRA